ncbi:ABC transporter substrate-binding protein [Diplocloster hominis]|uniref:ABC transporter substrate-binding protein n=1 Tax=Diplocloster hominis TaxID=3079010 RepID=UPI0031B9BC1F
MKKLLVSLLVLCMFTTMFGCGASGNAKSSNSPADSNTPAGNAAPADSEAPDNGNGEAAKTAVKFYGLVKEFADGDQMVQMVQEQLPQYKIEPIQVDWANLATVISTGIASGEPCDVYAYWPAAMKQFVNAGQALDLTPYLDANGGQWRSQFNPGVLALGTYDGKVYNIPYGTSFGCMFVNKTAMEKAGLEVKRNWTYDQFMTDMQALQDSAGMKAPFAVDKDQIMSMFAYMFRGKANENGNLDALGSAEYQFNSEEAKEALEKYKALYDSGLWYGGHDGGLSVSRDEVTSAFLRGEVGAIVESAAVYGTLVEQCDFEVGVVFIPNLLDDPSKATVMGFGDGLFVPANCANPEGAVEAIKAFTSAEVQKVHAESGFLITNVNVEIENPEVSELVSITTSGFDSRDYANISPKFQDFEGKRLIPDVFLNGKAIPEALNEYEALRQEVMGN